eukprot:17197_1
MQQVSSETRPIESQSDIRSYMSGTAAEGETSKKCTPLILAVHRRDLASVEQIMASENARVNACDEARCTALITAAARGYENIVSALIESVELDPNVRGGACGETAVIAAARGDHAEVMKTLAERRRKSSDDLAYIKVDFNVKDDSGDTGLIIAARNGFAKVIKLFEFRKFRDADFNIVGANDETALIAAITHGHTEVVKMLTSRSFTKGTDTDPVVNINARGGKGDTPLMVATRLGLAEMVKLLVGSLYLDPNLTHGDENETALMVAAREGRAGIVGHLLTADALRVNMSSTIEPDDHSSSKTALQIAVHVNHAEVVRVLLTHPAIRVHAIPKEITGCECCFRDPLHVACEKNTSEVVRALIESPKTDVNFLFKGDTPLTVSAREGSAESIRVLLTRADCDRHVFGSSGHPVLALAASRNENGACALLEDGAVDVNAVRDVDSSTPIQHAARRGFGRAVKVMITRGANINAADKYGNTPLIDAAREGHVVVVRALLDSGGVNTRARNSAGRSAQFVAKNRGNLDIVRILTEHGDL